MDSNARGEVIEYYLLVITLPILMSNHFYAKMIEKSQAQHRHTHIRYTSLSRKDDSCKSMAL